MWFSVFWPMSQNLLIWLGWVAGSTDLVLSPLLSVMPTLLIWWVVLPLVVVCRLWVSWSLVRLISVLSCLRCLDSQRAYCCLGVLQWVGDIVGFWWEELLTLERQVLNWCLDLPRKGQWIEPWGSSHDNCRGCSCSRISCVQGYLQGCSWYCLACCNNRFKLCFLIIINKGVELCIIVCHICWGVQHS